MSVPRAVLGAGRRADREHAADRSARRRDRWSTGAACRPAPSSCPGSRARAFPAGTYGMPCGLIIGERTSATDDKVALNDLLRDFGSSLS